jgi:hypothetical protein
MIFVTTMLINTAYRLKALVWVIALSIGFYGVKGGIFTLLTGGAFASAGPQRNVHRRQQRDRAGTRHDRPVPVLPQPSRTEKIPSRRDARCRVVDRIRRAWERNRGAPCWGSAR